MFICNSRDKKNDKHMLTILAKNKVNIITAVRQDLQ